MNFCISWFPVCIPLFIYHVRSDQIMIYAERWRWDFRWLEVIKVTLHSYLSTHHYYLIYIEREECPTRICAPVHNSAKVALQQAVDQVTWTCLISGSQLWNNEYLTSPLMDNRTNRIFNPPERIGTFRVCGVEWGGLMCRLFLIQNTEYKVQVEQGI